LKAITRMIAAHASNASFVAFDPRDVYTTGLSYLFAQPEYSQPDVVQRMSQAVDQLDDLLGRLFSQSDQALAILVGSQSPLGRECSTMVVRYRTPEHSGMLGVFGPVRMDYPKNLALLRYSQELIDNFNRLHDES